LNPYPASYKPKCIISTRTPFIAWVIPGEVLKHELWVKMFSAEYAAILPAPLDSPPSFIQPKMVNKAM